MRNFRKTLVLAFSLLLTTGLFAMGCENQGGQEGAEQEQAEPQEAEQQEAAQEQANQQAAQQDAEQGAQQDGGQQTQTHEGTIREVNADEREIYVTADGQTLELYFIDQTKLTRNGEPAEFSALEQGQKVRVEVRQVGKRLDPLAVEILE